MSNLTWDSARAIAEIIIDKYPNTDVLSLTDKGLLGMMADTGILSKLPEIDADEREDCLFSVKCALSRVIENDEDYNGHQNDALV